MSSDPIVMQKNEVVRKGTPTVCALSDFKRRHLSMKHNENCWPFVNQPSTDSRPTIGRQIADSWSTNGRLSDDRRCLLRRNCSLHLPTALIISSEIWEAIKLFGQITFINEPSQTSSLCEVNCTVDMVEGGVRSTASKT